MHELLERIDGIVTKNDMNMYRVSISTAEGIETLERIPSNPCQNSYSVAKFFCVTAIGMLFDEGKISIDTSVGDIFACELEQYGIPREKWTPISVDNVLRHEIGFEKGFLDIDQENITEYPTDDFLELALSTPLVYPPATVRVYSDAAYYIASRIVTKLSGERLDDFLMSRLFSKLGCREVAWARCPKNYTIGATGLYMQSNDIVKLGRIYLDGGLWKGERIISEEWIRIVLERGYELRKWGRGYSKGGMRGQRLYVNYEDNVAIAWHSFDPYGKATQLLEIL